MIWLPSTFLLLTEPPKCVEKMGVENGQLSDLQIMVSSVLNDQEDFFGKQNIRLHTEPVTYLSAGAWVAKPKPDQFVRVSSHAFMFNIFWKSNLLSDPVVLLMVADATFFPSCEPV